MSSRPPQTRGVGWGDLPFVVAAALAALTVLYLGRSLTFWHDEWRSITFDGGWSDFLRPVNEHWSAFPLLLYRATFHVVGLDSYVPYLAEVVVLHAIAVAGAYVLVRRRIGRPAATLIAIPLLLLGSGAENLFWAFQTGFVGSVAFGVWALAAIEQRGKWPPIATAVLLVASLLSSGIGLVFLVAVPVRALLDPPLRRRALAVVPPLVLYLAWYAWAGHDPVDDRHVAPPLDIARFVWRGVEYSTAAVTGTNRLSHGVTVAGVGFVAALAALGWAAIARRPRPLATASLLGIVALYVLAGSVRAHLEFDYAVVSRYVYVAGFLLALAVADGLELLRARLGPARPRQMLWIASVAVGCVVVTLVNVGPLRGSRDALLDQADRTRAFVALARQYHGEPWVDPTTGYGVMPPVPELVRTVEAHASPTEDRFFPSVARTPSPAAHEEALLVLLGDRFRSEAASAQSSPPVPMKVVDVVDARVVARRDCFTITAAGPRPSATFVGPDGSRFRMSASGSEPVTASLGFALTPALPIVVDLDAGTPVDVVVPDVTPVTSARLRIEPAASASPVTVCPRSGAPG